MREGGVAAVVACAKLAVTLGYTDATHTDAGAIQQQ